MKLQERERESELAFSDGHLEHISPSFLFLQLLERRTEGETGENRKFLYIA